MHKWTTFLGMLLSSFLYAAEQIIFQERFEAPTLAAAWHIDASDGNILQVKDGCLEIRASVNSFAHVERALGQDLITATCRMRGGQGISWCPSLFLYWTAGDWCQMGVIERDGGRYYVTEMVGGNGSEFDLATTKPTDWHYVRIELGKDCIRYLSSEDGKCWTLQLCTQRPEELAGPPKLLILGKGYGRGDSTYPHPDLDNDYASKGGMTLAYFDDVEVRLTASDRLQASNTERVQWQMRGEDPVGEKELTKPGDPTFESVSAYFPPLRHPREAVGVKEHPLEIGVATDGTLQLSESATAKGAPTVAFSVGNPPLALSKLPPPKRALADGFLPVVILQFEDRGIIYEETVFGYSEGLKSERPLWAFVRFRVPPQVESALQVALRHAPEVQPLRLVLVGKEPTVCLRIPYALRTINDIQEITHSEFEARLEEVRRFWRALLERGMKIRTPESRVNDAYRAWLAYAFLDVDHRGDRFEPHDGSGFYEAIYGYSAALYCNALDLYGLHEEAELYLESLLRKQNPDGLYMENYGLPDNGAVVWAAVQHYRLTGRAEWLGRMAPVLIKCCDWAIRERQKNITPEGQKRTITHGLIRGRPYCDYNKPAVNYYADAYNWVGIAALASALTELGIADGARLRKEADSYRQDILISMDAATIEKDGMKIIPMEPETQRLLKSTRYRAGGYYGLVASMFLESGLLDVHDPRSLLITEFMERRGGLIAGQCEFGRGIDHAYTYGYWLTQLKRNEIKRVLLGFYGMLAYGMTRDTYSGVECTQITTGANAHTLPHLYSCTQQLRLLRMMLVCEDGAELILACATPRSWLAHGQRLEVCDATTLFGSVSYCIKSEVNSGRIVAEIAAPKRTPPRCIHLRLRHPADTPITRVLVNGQHWPRFTKDSVELTEISASIKVEVFF